MRIERITVVLGSTLMAAVFVFSFVRAGQKLAGSSSVAAAAPSAVGVAAVMGVDGVQRVTLGFGRFNYEPDTIRIRRGVPVELTAAPTIRGCFSSFIIPDFGVQKLFTATDRTLAFTPTRAGTFRFSCAMGMGSGRLIVEG